MKNTDSTTQAIESSFELDGDRYFLEGRKCSNKNCKCQNGELHGPYWWKRDAFGQRKYMKKELPPEVVAAYKARNTQREKMHSRLAYLEDLGDSIEREKAALRALASDRYITDGQKAIAVRRGFGECFLSTPEAQETEELIDDIIGLDSFHVWAHFEEHPAQKKPNQTN